MTTTYDELEQAVANLRQPRYDWVHPSWRDVVIEHLMTHPADRRRFLSRCGTAGLELALSVSGGAEGERALPFLTALEDWRALRIRAVQLVPTLDDRGLEQLMRPLRGLSAVVSDEHAAAQASELQLEVLQSVAAHWDSRRDPLPTTSLALFYEISVETSPLVAGPQLANTWRAHQPALADVGDPPRPRRLRDPLDFLVLVLHNEPRALRQFNWPDRYEEIFPPLISAASAAAESAEELLEQIDAGGFMESDEAADASLEALLWRRIVAGLRELGLSGDQPATLESRLRTAEGRLDTWLEEREDEAADRLVEADDFDEEFDDSDETELPFSVSAIFSDL